MGQQPSYYRIGEQELAGVDIYSILQEDNGDVWLSTNDGLIRYDGYTFHSYSSEALKSRSLFGLKTDAANNLFCVNLSGQFFTIRGDSLHLYYETPDSLMSGMIYFNFDNENRLVISRRNYHIVEHSGETRLLMESNDDAFLIAKNHLDELLLVDPLRKNISYFCDDTIRQDETNRLSFLSIPDFAAIDFLTIGERSYFTPHLIPKLFQLKNGNWEHLPFQPNKPLNYGAVIYPLSDSTYWEIQQNNGAYVFDKDGQALYDGVLLLPRYRISCYLEDQEGNLWLPTLGKGIIIIPNKNFIDFRNHELLKEDDIKCIAADTSGTVYIGGAKGWVYKIDEQHVEVFRKSKIKIELLNYFEAGNILVHYWHKTQLSKSAQSDILNVFEGSKDLIQIEEEEYVIATYTGVKLLSNGQNAPFYKEFANYQGVQKNEYGMLFSDLGRSTSLLYDSTYHSLWVATVTGVKVLSQKAMQVPLFEGQKIMATDLAFFDERVWVATRDAGVLIFENQKLVGQLHTGNGLMSNEVIKLKASDDKLYIANKSGFQEYDMATQHFENISPADGLLSQHILDFEIVDDKVWLVFQQGVQRIDWSKRPKEEHRPVLGFEKLLVNDQQFSFEEKGDFAYDQNQFEFNFQARGFRHRGNLIYEYLLEGEQEHWQQNSFENNQVKYTALRPGAYTFKVRAANENHISSAVINYPFVVRAPFWEKWWFFVLCGLGIVAVVASFFIIRIRIIKKRLILEKRLQASEVTAIKAQMNPHFIFNALNSIQSFIAEGDKYSATCFLSGFARLIRSTLQRSTNSSISLEEELLALEQYLKLEQLRFRNLFNYTIQVDPKLDTSDIQFPPMLLQPFVENAILHGLRPKGGAGEIKIKFSSEKEKLIVSIEDNGIGFKQSQLTKSKQQQVHQSIGLDLARKRLDLFNGGIKNAIHLQELINVNGQVKGTLATLCIVN